MKSVNSLSGGKTSSYLAVHYPADYEVFALVRIEDKRCSPSEWLRKQVEDKLGMDFIATTEDDKTLRVMFELEQKLGREIKWLSGETFEQLLKRKSALPNQFWRFCTSELKIKPIFEWWQKEFGNEIIKMRCGFRYDEQERKDTFETTFKTIVGKSKNGKRNKWANIEWRVGDFPLIDDRINHWHIAKYWRDLSKYSSRFDFPPDSNCVGCFWKQEQQLRKNWEDNPEKMRWFAEQETKLKRRWKKGMTYDSIAKLGLQQDFMFGTGSGCMSGECSN